MPAAQVETGSPRATFNGQESAMMSSKFLIACLLAILIGGSVAAVMPDDNPPAVQSAN
jgi:hypothetical protein